MENYSFKSVPFGGFDKQDVVHYIQQSSEKAAAVQRELEVENGRLRKRTEELEGRLADLTKELETLRDQRDRLEEDLKRERAVREDLEPLRSLTEETARLRDEAESLRPDAEAYVRFRDRLGTIECEARKRADDLEAASAQQMKKTIDAFQVQYQSLLKTFEAASIHMTGELRKIELSLSQMPRIMDQTTAELHQFSTGLNSGTESRKDGRKILENRRSLENKKP